MKYRTGLVSNSSNSSFIVKRGYFNEEQLAALHDIEFMIDLWEKQGKDLSELGCYKGEWLSDWNVSFGEDKIEFYCSMDNFSMVSFLEMIGIDVDKIEWN